MPIVSTLAAMLLLPSVQLDSSLNGIAEKALIEFKSEGLKRDDFALTFVEIGKDGSLQQGHYNGNLPMYPASVVKMFYMARAYEMIRTGKLKTTKEFDRAMTDMIRESINDATGMVLDTITDTTGGAELSEGELKKWMKKRNSVNEWLKSLGFSGINCNQKTWNEGPYGRERQGYGPNFELRNSLTANSCADMMSRIMTDKITSPELCSKMRDLLSRQPASKEDGQVTGFIGAFLPSDSKLWSKAGWTSTVRHDVACIQRGDRRTVLVVFTKHRVNETKLMYWLSKELLLL